MKSYKPRQAAELLGVSERTVHRYCADGKLGRQNGVTWTITERELKAFAARPRRGPGRPSGTIDMTKLTDEELQKRIEALRRERVRRERGD